MILTVSDKMISPCLCERTRLDRTNAWTVSLRASTTRRSTARDIEREDDERKAKERGEAQRSGN